eukprot:GFYU01009715.1.p1 GENE.GFYU01009715.1~~GFYU01009715.1.p1  ORF type:complete len:304 (-),score=99.05 GFYU01009715.1:385-1206(-)
MKTFIFQFVNSYASLFYYAFFERNIDIVSEQLGAIFITRQILANVQEYFWPRLAYWSRKKAMERKKRRLPYRGEGFKKIVHEAMLETYNFDDFSELVIQFGYVVFFAPAFPMAIACAAVNNMFEIRIDAHHMLNTYQRPDPHLASDIGKWMSCLEMVSISAVVVNCLIVCYTTDELKVIFGEDLTWSDRLLAFLVIEHIMLVLKMFLSSLIQDVPARVRRRLMPRDRTFAQEGGTTTAWEEDDIEMDLRENWEAEFNKEFRAKESFSDPTLTG